MNNKNLSNSNLHLFGKISELLISARKNVAKSINQTIVLTYFEIGRLIIEDEQQGQKRAEYGKSILKELSKKLSIDFGKGYSVYNLERMRKFYLNYEDVIADFQISATLLRNSESPFNLSWSHYLQLIKIDNRKERRFYEIEASNNNWSVRELERQYNSSLYERLLLSRDKDGVKELSKKGQVIPSKEALKHLIEDKE